MKTLNRHLSAQTSNLSRSFCNSIWSLLVLSTSLVKALQEAHSTWHASLGAIINPPPPIVYITYINMNYVSNAVSIEIDIFINILPFAF